jgi:G3E family GTPase
VSAPIPITLLTGFLGAGKTTLVNRALSDPRHARTAVIVNELSHVGLDGALIQARSGQSVQMTTGCICCSSGGDAVQAIADLGRLMEHYEIDPVERVVVETTGMADPSPVVPALLMDRRIAGRFRLTRIVTAVDAIRGAVMLDRFEEARRQVGMADLIALTKTDLVEDAVSRVELAGLKERLARLGPGAVIVDVHQDGDLAAGLLDSARPWGRDDDGERWLGMRAATRETGAGGVKRVSRHDPRVASIALCWSGPVDGTALLQGLQKLIGAGRNMILRVKGIVAATDDPARPMVVHAVTDVLGEPVRLNRWPTAEGEARMSRLVIIGEGLVESDVRRALGIPAPGAPRPLAEVRS